MRQSLARSRDAVLWQGFFQRINIQPEAPAAVVGLALVERSRGHREQSLALIDKGIELAPYDPESWYQRGETLRTLGDSDGALAAFDKALEINPVLFRPRLGRATEYLSRGSFAESLADARIVKDINPDDLLAAFIEWQALAGLGHEAESNTALSEFGQRLNEISEEALMREPYLLRLASWFTLARHDLARSERYLTQFIQLNPHDPTMQLLLGRVKLMLGDPKAAISVLFPISQRYPNNVSILFPLGQAYFKVGHYAEATAMLERAAVLAPENTEISAQLALSRIGIGRWEDAVGGLEELIESNRADDNSVSKAGLLLALLQFKAGDLKQALQTVNSLVGERPSPRAYNLLGMIEASMGNYAGARQAFEETLKLKPFFVPAAYNLSKFDLAEGNIAAATRRLEELVEHNPRSASPLLGLSDIELSQGHVEKAVRWLEKAVDLVPDDIVVHARLINLYLSIDEDEIALRAAQKLTARLPDNGLAIETLARALAATGDKVEARRQFLSAVRYSGFNGSALMRIAQQQVLLEDYPNARKTLLKASQSSLPAKTATNALVRLDIQLKHYDAALARIKEFEGTDDAALGHLLMGELLLAQGQTENAISAFKIATEMNPNTQTILGLFGAIDASGRRPEAIELLENWTAEHPDDSEAKRKLALWYLPLQQLDKSQALLEELLPGDPADPVLLSNLARIYQLKGDERARKLAERAVAVRPNWPVALDTLGWILATEGDSEAGLEYLRQASVRSDNPLTRYHLAQTLNELGRTREAKTELKRLLDSGQSNESMRDVQKMYDALD
ncbi:MAG: PEP-CTERM system TPR-repeat protein PrsT [Proteobacteria bacterium]|nr:PEP-CTERM system TPR-repeat protein PrsT [Pseudomonadota bacterium]